MFTGINITGSGMTASKKWLEVTSNNITNASTTRTSEGTPYKRQAVVLEERNTFSKQFDEAIGNGVQVKKVIEDDEVVLVHNPEHPDADVNGNVRMPNVDLTAEMTNLLVAQRSYEASVNAYNANKQILEKEMEIGKY